MSENRQAEQIVWDGPGGVQMSLKPEPDGLLAVEVENGVVTVTGKQCRHSQGEGARKPKDVAHQILTEVQMTILTRNARLLGNASWAPNRNII